MYIDGWYVTDRPSTVESLTLNERTSLGWVRQDSGQLKLSFNVRLHFEVEIGS